MKTAILLVSFGTRYKEARENSIEAVYNDIAKANDGIKVYQAYTSPKIIKKLAFEGINIYNIEEAVDKAIEDGIENLKVVSTHIIPGHEYNKMCAILAPFKRRFKKIDIATPFLYKEEDCERAVKVLERLIDFKSDCAYILMGHGTDAEANVRYAQMNTAFEKAGHKNVCIASVEEHPDIYDAIEKLNGTGIKKVVVQPFMLVAGDHARNDMAGEENSFVTILNENGYETEAVIKGLGEYPQFREIYVRKVEEMK